MLFHPIAAPEAISEGQKFFLRGMLLDPPSRHMLYYASTSIAIKYTLESPFSKSEIRHCTVVTSSNFCEALQYNLINVLTLIVYYFNMPKNLKHSLQFIAFLLLQLS